MSTQPTFEERVALRVQAEERRHALLRQRIAGIRQANRSMPIREIAYRIGVSIAVVEDALGEKAAPDYVG